MSFIDVISVAAAVITVAGFSAVAVYSTAVVLTLKSRKETMRWK